MRTVAHGEKTLARIELIVAVLIGTFVIAFIWLAPESPRGAAVEAAVTTRDAWPVVEPWELAFFLAASAVALTVGAFLARSHRG